MKSHYSAIELLKFNLDCLPKTERGIHKKTIRENWSFIEVAALGGKGGKRKEYAPPPAILAAIRAKQTTELLQSTTTTLPDLPKQLPIPAEQQQLTERQSSVEGARKGVLTAITRLIETTGCSKEAAMQTLLTQAKLPEFEQIRRLFELATDPRGKTDSLPSTRTIKRWFLQSEQKTLAPKIREKNMKIPAWAKDFLGWWQQPQKPSIPWAYEKFVNGYEGTPPSIHAVRRFLDKLGNVTREHGRMGSRELRNIQVFTRRSFDTLLPTDIYTADGHSFDAEVAHPLHGRPWRPEITTVEDVATRKIVGWSVDLAESALAVLAAISHAAITNGIPAIFYTDNGPGYDNAMMTDDAVGLMGRMGTEIVNSIAYNSQSRGVIERLHKTVWVSAAKELPTYIGADMDKQAKQLAFKLTRKALKTGKPQRIAIMQFDEFVSFCDEKVAQYNNRPHRSLPKITDSTGKRRHMAPNELWQVKILQGAEVCPVSEEEAAYLFKPQVQRTIRRGEIEFIGNRYFNHALEEFHGEKLNIAYDIHNAEKVWVYDDTGRLICTADFNGNAEKYQPDSFVEQKRDQRALGRIRRKEANIEEIRAEHRGQPVIENQASITIAGTTINTLNLADLNRHREEALLSIKSKQTPTETTQAKPIAEPTNNGFFVPEEPNKRFELFNHLIKKGDLSAQENKWVSMYQRSHEYQALSKHTVNM